MEAQQRKEVGLTAQQHSDYKPAEPNPRASQERPAPSGQPTTTKEKSNEQFPSQSRMGKQQTRQR